MKNKKHAPQNNESYEVLEVIAVDWQSTTHQGKYKCKEPNKRLDYFEIVNHPTTFFVVTEGTLDNDTPENITIFDTMSDAVDYYIELLAKNDKDF